MREPFLSIITINYNNLNGLKRTMSSVFKQSYKDIEYIIIDGGSDDGSLDLIKQNEERIGYWVSEKDYGVFHAQNKGIELANGQYLLFLNSGDVLNGNRALEDFITHKDFHGDIIYGDYKFEEGEKIYPDKLYAAYFMKTSLPHQSTFFKQRIFEEMGGYDESYRIGSDRAFYVKCYLSEKYHFQHIPYFLTIFDLSGLSNEPSENHLKREEDMRLLKDMYGDDYPKYKKELEEELERNRVPKYSWKGIMKRIKKRLS
jgi:glycosyltransferase involved in cell wall biosynthesis